VFTLGSGYLFRITSLFSTYLVGVVNSTGPILGIGISLKAS